MKKLLGHSPLIRHWWGASRCLRGGGEWGCGLEYCQEILKAANGARTASSAASLERWRGSKFVSIGSERFQALVWVFDFSGRGRPRAYCKVNLGGRGSPPSRLLIPRASGAERHGRRWSAAGLARSHSIPPARWRRWSRSRFPRRFQRSVRSAIPRCWPAS